MVRLIANCRVMLLDGRLDLCLRGGENTRFRVKMWWA